MTRLNVLMIRPTLFLLLFCHSTLQAALAKPNFLVILADGLGC
jgi:hypothetical protein